jgi:hypothetical protein
MVEPLNVVHAMALEKKEKDEKQKLVDICFEITITVAKHKSFSKMSTEQLAEWTAKQLRDCGFDTQPVGASWGVLLKK